MCASHMNHSVGCIKERIKLPGTKYGGICINQETCHISVLFSETCYGLLCSSLTITDVTSYVQ